MEEVANQTYRFEASPDFLAWAPLATLAGFGTLDFLDLDSRGESSRYYQAVRLEGSAHLTGDHLVTEDGDLVIHPVEHASFVMRWNQGMIYNDPVGGEALYAGLPLADLILVSHQHGDHCNANTLNAVKGPDGVIIAPASVAEQLPPGLLEVTITPDNSESVELLGLHVEAVPAYNSRQPRERDNGYVLTLGGRRLYMADDTEDTLEMRALEGIDVAFLPMNTPFTMTVERAADVVRAFRPRVVYHYHYRNQDGSFADLERFAALVGTDVDVVVRRRNWY